MSETKSIESETPAAVAGAAPCSALRRYRLVMEAGCRRNWRPHAGSDSHYLNWLYWEAMSKEHNITAEEADKAWNDFLARHGDLYPHGSWRETELYYERTHIMPNEKS